MGQKQIFSRIFQKKKSSVKQTRLTCHDNNEYTYRLAHISLSLSVILGEGSFSSRGYCQLKPFSSHSLHFPGLNKLIPKFRIDGVSIDGFFLKNFLKFSKLQQKLHPARRSPLVRELFNRNSPPCPPNQARS